MTYNSLYSYLNRVLIGCNLPNNTSYLWQISYRKSSVNYVRCLRGTPAEVTKKLLLSWRDCVLNPNYPSKQESVNILDTLIKI